MINILFPIIEFLENFRHAINKNLIYVIESIVVWIFVGISNSLPLMIPEFLMYIILTNNTVGELSIISEIVEMVSRLCAISISILTAYKIINELRKKKK
jgi:hypothetical protein